MNRYLKSPGFMLTWIIRKVLFLATLVVATTMLLMLPDMLVREGVVSGGWYVTTGFHLEFRPYWQKVLFHLSHLLHGQLIPPGLSPGRVSPLQSLPSDLIAYLPVTLKLIGTAFLISMAAGMLLGLLLSVFAPTWLRVPLWGFTTAIHSVPDLLLATAMDLSVVLVTIARGGLGPTQGSEAWQKFWAPTLALAVLVLPYIARMTAAAIDEISVQEYIRAAVSRGLHPGAILVRHIGKNVLIQVWTAIPVVASLLVSGAAVVEYMMEVHGAGRALILAVRQGGDRYEGIAFLIPLLLLFTVALALSEMGQRLLDPRVAGGEVAAADRPAAAGAAGAWRLPRVQWRRLLPALRAFGGNLAEAFGEALSATPDRLRRAGKALRDPVLLAGSLLVVGLVAVAILAPQLAPFDPQYRAAIYQDATGKLFVPPFLPDKLHLLGTDDLGRDLLSRVIYGTRYALLFAGLAVPTRFVLAVLFGLLAAFRGGIWEKLIAWLSTFFTAVPQVVLPLVLIPTANLFYLNDHGATLTWGVLLVALPGIPRMAASVRQQALEVMAQPFVEGARAVGAGTARTIFRHIFPQMLPQLATMFALEVPAVLTLTAVLGYFKANPGGVVVDTASFKPIAPVIPEWGSLMEIPLMVLLAGRWWMAAPFVALFVSVLAFNMLGEGLRRQWASQTGWRWK
jgi:ABC-type dipeptide/oligopeptide/nickel transport system permease subunit